MKKILSLFLFLGVLFLVGCTNSNQISNNKKIMQTNENGNYIVTIKTTMGDIKLELFEKDAPNTVDNFIELSKSGFYDGVKFHRVIKDFMIQAGDPLSKDSTKKDYWGTGGPGYSFADEFNSNKLVRGSIAMANSGPNTNGSQFFIVTAESTSWLDGKHTNFGKVIEGMDIVAAIEKVQTGESDRPVEDVVITGVSVQ